MGRLIPGRTYDPIPASKFCELVSSSAALPCLHNPRAQSLRLDTTALGRCERTVRGATPLFGATSESKAPEQTPVATVRSHRGSPLATSNLGGERRSLYVTPPDVHPARRSAVKIAKGMEKR